MTGQSPLQQTSRNRHFIALFYTFLYNHAMKFNELLNLVDSEPLFETGLLLAGQKNPGYIRRQLSGWVRAGKLYQLRRGLYAVAPPFRQRTPHPFVIANQIVPGSYVSLQAGLAHYDLIPEHVPVMTSVTSSRPGTWQTPLGRYEYRHLQPALMYGYQAIEVRPGQWAFVARPAKALLDMVYLHPGGDAVDYLRELRLQNVHLISPGELSDFAQRAQKPKLERAAKALISLIEQLQAEYEAL